MSKQEAYFKGFDAGNYGNAYESQDWESWYASQCDRIPSEHREAYEHGMLLGFFSSYELSEIHDDAIAEQVAALRAQYGDE